MKDERISFLSRIRGSWRRSLGYVILVNLPSLNEGGSEERAGGVTESIKMYKVPY
jgi:hypothetical protein